MKPREFFQGSRAKLYRAITQNAYYANFDLLEMYLLLGFSSNLHDFFTQAVEALWATNVGNRFLI